MADILLDAQSAPVTPAAGQAVIFVDTPNQVLSTKDANGLVRGLGPVNYSVAAQAPAAATRTYLTGSALRAPSGGFQIGHLLRWRIGLTKTAAGVAASTVDICFGTAGTTADPARLSFTKPAGTAAADVGWIDIDAIIRGPISASGVVVGTFRLIHNLSATGFATTPCVVANTVSGAFDITNTELIAGVCITTGAADAYTVQQVCGVLR